MAHHGEKIALGEVCSACLFREIAHLCARRFQFHVRLCQSLIGEHQRHVSLNQFLPVMSACLQHFLKCRRQRLDFITMRIKRNRCGAIRCRNRPDEIAEAA